MVVSDIAEGLLQNQKQTNAFIFHQAKGSG